MFRRACLLILLTACGAAPAPAPAITNNAAASAPVASASPARAVDWKNFTYRVSIGDVDESWKVRDGHAERQDPQFGEVESVDVDAPVYGDVDHDGVEEALVRVTYSGGGTGHFDTVHVFRVTPAGPREVAMIPGGDRGDGGIQSVTVDDHVRVVRLASQDGDGACCPSMVQHETWYWAGSDLVEDKDARELKPRPAQ